ncbi:hypothetical protein B0I24_101246 [Aliidiomarina maris]|uniref:Uncharacterized protein n=1 Tax=Aliidiomarina maris TaxID=531312 RepID=A0A327X6V4_9GAMM|nr:hypothetical protein B0I24_101246 [Aliidiomarina maris]
MARKNQIMRLFTHAIVVWAGAGMLTILAVWVIGR